MKNLPTILLGLALALALTACGGGDGGAGETVDAGDGPIQIEAGDDLAFDPANVSAAAGEIEVELENTGSVEHDVVVEEADDTVVVHANGGETATGTIELDAGTYTFYCSIPGHREAGMEGTLEVQ